MVFELGEQAFRDAHIGAQPLIDGLISGMGLPVCESVTHGDDLTDLWDGMSHRAVSVAPPVMRIGVRCWFSIEHSFRGESKTPAGSRGFGEGWWKGCQAD